MNIIKKISVIVALAVASVMPSWAQDTDELYNRLYPQIMQASQGKDYQRVVSLMDELLQAKADISEIETLYAVALNGVGRTDEAINRLNAYLKAEPTDVSAYYTLGELYQAAGNQPQAQAQWEKCIELRPNNSKPYVAIARMAGMENKTVAMDYYNKAIAIFIDAKQPNGAVQLGIEAMNIDPEDLKLLVQLGNALSMAGMVDNALPFYAEAIGLASSAVTPPFDILTEANVGLAKIYYDKGDYDSALTYLLILIENDDVTRAFPERYRTALQIAADCYDKKCDTVRADELRTKAQAIE